MVRASLGDMIIAGSLGGEIRMKEYKKSYKGFVFWLMGFCLACCGCVFLPDTTTQISVAFVDNVMVLGCFILSFIIYKTEYVYWYNGTSYEEAKAAGSVRRKQYARRHMKRFGYFALGFLAYSIVSVVIGIPYGIDISVAAVGLISVAVSTININL